MNDDGMNEKNRNTKNHVPSPTFWDAAVHVTSKMGFATYVSMLFGAVVLGLAIAMIGHLANEAYTWAFGGVPLWLTIASLSAFGASAGHALVHRHGTEWFLKNALALLTFGMMVGLLLAMKATAPELSSDGGVIDRGLNRLIEVLPYGLALLPPMIGWGVALNEDLARVVSEHESPAADSSVS